MRFTVYGKIATSISKASESARKKKYIYIYEKMNFFQDKINNMRMADRFFNIIPAIYTLATKNLAEFVLSTTRMERNANPSQ